MQMLVKIISKKKILHVILDVHVDAGIARLDGSQRSSAATVELYWLQGRRNVVAAVRRGTVDGRQQSVPFGLGQRSVTIADVRPILQSQDPS